MENLLWSWLQSIAVPEWSSHVHNQQKATKKKKKKATGQERLFLHLHFKYTYLSSHNNV